MLFFRQLQIIRHFFGWTLSGFSCLFAICAIHNKRSLGYGAPVHCFFCKKPDALESTALYRFYEVILLSIPTWLLWRRMAVRPRH